MKSRKLKENSDRALEQASPFLNAVGMNVDMRGVVPKN